MHGIKLRLTFCSGTFDLSIIQVSAKYWEITGNLNAIWFSAAFRNYLLNARVRLRRTGRQKFCGSKMFLNGQCMRRLLGEGFAL